MATAGSIYNNPPQQIVQLPGGQTRMKRKAAQAAGPFIKANCDYFNSTDNFGSNKLAKKKKRKEIVIHSDDDDCVPTCDAASLQPIANLDGDSGVKEELADGEVSKAAFVPDDVGDAAAIVLPKSPVLTGSSSSLVNTPSASKSILFVTSLDAEAAHYDDEDSADDLLSAAPPPPNSSSPPPPPVEYADIQNLIERYAKEQNKAWATRAEVFERSVEQLKTELSHTKTQLEKKSKCFLDEKRLKEKYWKQLGENKKKFEEELDHQRQLRETMNKRLHEEKKALEEKLQDNMDKLESILQAPQAPPRAPSTLVLERSVYNRIYEQIIGFLRTSMKRQADDNALKRLGGSSSSSKKVFSVELGLGPSRVHVDAIPYLEKVTSANDALNPVLAEYNGHKYKLTWVNETQINQHNIEYGTNRKISVTLPSSSSSSSSSSTMPAATQADFCDAVCKPFVDLADLDAHLSTVPFSMEDFGGRREKVHSKELAELATYMSSFSYDPVQYRISNSDLWVDPALLKTFLHCVKDTIKYEKNMEKSGKVLHQKSKLFVGWHGSSDYDSMFETAQVFDLNYSGKSGGQMRGAGVYLSYIADIAYEYPMHNEDKSALICVGLDMAKSVDISESFNRDVYNNYSHHTHKNNKNNCIRMRNLSHILVLGHVSQ
jgi:hypothetical protein